MLSHVWWAGSCQHLDTANRFKQLRLVLLGFFRKNLNYTLIERLMTYSSSGSSKDQYSNLGCACTSQHITLQMPNSAPQVHQCDTNLYQSARCDSAHRQIASTLRCSSLQPMILPKKTGYLGSPFLTLNKPLNAPCAMRFAKEFTLLKYHLEKENHSRD